MTHVKRTYLPFENSFTPNCELGINSKGKQLELSKEFLLTVLSAEVQKNDLYDGFAVNTKALLECSKQDVSGYSGTTDVINADGTTSMLEFYPLDEKQCNEVIDIYSTVNNKITANDSIAAAIMARAKDFFNGNQSASDAADAIIEEMNIYLSE
jgi:ABC-type glycerol-3-phosphate transport system substrate-binding protein